MTDTGDLRALAARLAPMGECGTKLLLGERDDGDHCPSCGSWIESVHEGKFEYCGCAPPEEWWVPAGDERLLGLVRATRDLIAEWVDARRRASDPLSTVIDRAEERALRGSVGLLARGWGVTGDDTEGDH